MGIIQSSPFTGLAGAALEGNRRVRHNGTAYVYAAAAERDDGVTAVNIPNGGYGLIYNSATDDLLSIEAAGTITAGAVVYGASNGRVQAGGGGIPVGIALGAAASGGLATVKRFAAGNGSVVGVEPHTADDTLTAAESGTVHTNTGAAGTVVLTLPPATPGLMFKFSVGANQAFRIDPNGTETISLPANGVPGAAGKYLGCSTIGASLQLECHVAGNWVAIGGSIITTVGGGTGVWIAEA